MVDFVTALTMLLREGLEAVLVIVAIVLYLVKGGHKRLTRAVYWGAAAGLLASFALAWALNIAVGRASIAQELIEGSTMFIAVLMLFYVSNWMLSQASGKRWDAYIQSMVQSSISRGAANTLILTAFLAVLREGAELVLFYTAAFSGRTHSPVWTAAGFGVGALLLVAVWVLIRYLGIRLPLWPIFYGTSLLLFAMCIFLREKASLNCVKLALFLDRPICPRYRTIYQDSAFIRRLRPFSRKLSCVLPIYEFSPPIFVLKPLRDKGVILCCISVP